MGDDSRGIPAFCRAHQKRNSSGTVLSMKVQPRSSQAGFLGFYGEDASFLKWGLRSAPTDGKANNELIREISRLFSLPRARVRLISGESSRSKAVLLEGLSPEEVLRELDKITGKS